MVLSLSSRLASRRARRIPAARAAMHCSSCETPLPSSSRVSRAATSSSSLPASCCRGSVPGITCGPRAAAGEGGGRQLGLLGPLVASAPPPISMASCLVASKTTFRLCGSRTSSSSTAPARRCASRSPARLARCCSSLIGTRCSASPAAPAGQSASPEASSSTCPNTSSHCLRRSRSRTLSARSTVMTLWVMFFLAGPTPSSSAVKRA
mmetsp:Transcript_11815/g.31410  ORF Transcript_11815/g.31410 Transcript_11815/m.31410 type:complete len:208 (+) Transcript_11815:353-976(+)